MKFASKKFDYSKAVGQWAGSLKAEYRKNKSVCIAEGCGYDQYFIVGSGDELSTENDDFTITEDMSRGRMARAFSDFSKSKKANRVFVTKFAETISSWCWSPITWMIYSVLLKSSDCI